MKVKLLIVLIVGMMLGGIALSNTASSAQKRTEDPNVTYYADVEQEIFDKTNELRISKGLSPLEHQSVLKSNARIWAVKLSIDITLSHSDVRKNPPAHAIWLGENVGITDNSTQALEMLIASPTHYANLIDPRFTHMDIGVVFAHGRYFFAQEFSQQPKATTTIPPPAATTAAIQKKETKCPE